MTFICISKAHYTLSFEHKNLLQVIFVDVKIKKITGTYSKKILLNYFY